MGSSCPSSPNFRVKKSKKMFVCCHHLGIPIFLLKLNLDDFRFQEMMDLFFGGEGGKNDIDSLSLVPSAQVQVSELILRG